MGQTVSHDASTGNVYITTDITGDAISQVLFIDSGLSVGDITPAPGWIVSAGPLLQFKPNTTLRADEYDNALICTLSSSPDGNTRVGLTTNSNDATIGNDEPWITRPLENITIGDTYTLIAQPYVKISNTVAIIQQLSISSNSETTTYEVDSDDFTVDDSDRLVAVYNSTPLGSQTVTVTATSGVQTDSTSIVVEVVTPTSVTPDAGVSLTAYVAIALQTTTFDEDGVDITHVQLEASSDVGILLNNVLQSDPITVTKANLPTVSLKRVLTRAPVDVEGVSYHLSEDGGLSYPYSGLLSVEWDPCFTPDALVRVDKRAYVNIGNLQSGDLIHAEGDRLCRVRSVYYSDPQLTALVVIQPNAFGYGRPWREVQVTPHHRLKINGRSKDAWKYIDGKRIVYKTVVSQLCHVELDRYCFINVDGVLAETWARDLAQIKTRDPRSWWKRPSQPQQKSQRPIRRAWIHIGKKLRHY